jgi:hypothetical protein
MHKVLPSEIEPRNLSELAADCQTLDPACTRGTPTTGTYGIPVAHFVRGPWAIEIPDRAASLLDGMPDYGD